MAVGVLVSGVALTPAVSSADSATEGDTATLNELLTTVFDSEAETFYEAFAGTNEVAATRVRKAFLQAKKAFHEARQEIQAIKKGDENPRQEVPSFFDDDEEGDGNGDEDDRVEDGYEIMPG